jgi:hypothetical protein
MNWVELTALMMAALTWPLLDWMRWCTWPRRSGFSHKRKRKANRSESPTGYGSVIATSPADDGLRERRPSTSLLVALAGYHNAQKWRRRRAPDSPIGHCARLAAAK